MNRWVIAILYTLMAATTAMNEDFLTALEAEGDRRYAPKHFEAWLQKNIRVKNGGVYVSYRFDGHEPLRYIARHFADHPDQVWMKNAQGGFTTFFTARGLHYIDGTSRKMQVLLTDDAVANEWTPDRLYTMIDNSPYLLKQKEASTGAWNTGLMQLGRATIVVRGLWNVKDAKSVDADWQLYDEVEEQKPEVMLMAEDRQIHAERSIVTKISQPGIPHQGIHAEYMDTNQMAWLVRCGCGHHNDLVERFVADHDSVFYKSRNGWIYPCEKCGKKLDNKRGAFVARFPDRHDRIGGQTSIFAFDFRTPEEVRDKWKKAQRSKYPALARKNFMISYVGLPHATDDEQPITRAVLNRPELHGGFGLRDECETWTCVGADQGDGVFFVFGSPTSDGRLRITNLAKFHVTQEAEQWALFRRMGVVSGLFDAMPNKSWALNMCRRSLDDFAIQYFGPRAAEREEYVPGFPEDVRVVHLNRDESLDETVEAIKDGFFLFPSKSRMSGAKLALFEEFEIHLMNLTREQREDGRTGKVLNSYKKRVANHFGMALNSLRISFLQLGESVPGPIVMG